MKSRKIPVNPARRPAAKRPVPIALLTGFEPFGGEDENPSQQIVRALRNRRIAGHRIVGAVLPTEFARSLPALNALIAQHGPVLVLALGQAGGRDGVGLERVAVNLIDARIPDNAGAQPVDVPVVDGAPNAYFSTLPLKAMLRALQAAGIPAALSQTAGTYVCNQVFFGLAHRLATRAKRVRGGFVHVPLLPRQAARNGNAPSMELATMILATRICLETALRTPRDIHFVAGSTH